jgi:hypothetical protein
MCMTTKNILLVPISYLISTPSYALYTPIMCMRRTSPSQTRMGRVPFRSQDFSCQADSCPTYVHRFAYGNDGPASARQSFTATGSQTRFTYELYSARSYRLINKDMTSIVCILYAGTTNGGFPSLNVSYVNSCARI